MVQRSVLIVGTWQHHSRSDVAVDHRQQLSTENLRHSWRQPLSQCSYFCVNGGYLGTVENSWAASGIINAIQYGVQTDVCIGRDTSHAKTWLWTALEVVDGLWPIDVRARFRGRWGGGCPSRAGVDDPVVIVTRRLRMKAGRGVELERDREGKWSDIGMHSHRPIRYENAPQLRKVGPARGTCSSSSSSVFWTLF
jgi:hypothetical protein